MTTTKNATAAKRTTTTKRVIIKKQTNSEKLVSLIKEIKENKTEGIVTLENGQIYTKVDYRLKKAREMFGFDLRIINKIIDKDEREVLVECSIYLKENGEWSMIQNAHSHETRDSSHMSIYNYIEIAETSAMGRALAGLGLFGNEFASVNEIESAVSHQKNNTPVTNKSTRKTATSAKKVKSITTEQVSHITDFLNKNKEFNVSDILDGYKTNTLDGLSEEEAGKVISYLNDNIADDVL
jgi:hypothetical protein